MAGLNYLIKKNVDPTRYTLEATKPYLYVGNNEGQYDIGGQLFREKLSGPKPKYVKTEKHYNLYNHLTSNAIKHIKSILKTNRTELTKSELMCLANHPIRNFAGFEKEIYKAFEKIGQFILIPMDLYKLVMEDEYTN